MEVKKEILRPRYKVLIEQSQNNPSPTADIEPESLLYPRLNVVLLSTIISFLNPVHASKAKSQICVTFDGIEILVILLQPLNAYSPIFVT